MMTKFWISTVSLWILLGCSLESASILRERFMGAKAGDYVVTESNKMVSLIAIRSLNMNSLVLEEISAPIDLLQPRPASWSDWVRQHAPGHTSWSMIEIDLDTHQLVESYSFSRSAWMELSSQESLVTTLLALDLSLQPTKEQRRIGPEPINGEVDTRKVWYPPMVVEGKAIESIDYHVYQTTWPDDHSVIANHPVVLYFDSANRSPFPIWIRLETDHATASIRMIDSGTNLPIHYRTIPRRVPEFLDMVQKTENSIRLSLKSPRYYHHFDLFAVDVTSGEKEIFPISHTVIMGEGETIHLEIPQNELQLNHRYTWLVVPAGHCEFYSESCKPYYFKPE